MGRGLEEAFCIERRFMTNLAFDWALKVIYLTCKRLGGKKLSRMWTCKDGKETVSKENSVDKGTEGDVKGIMK